MPRVDCITAAYVGKWLIGMSGATGRVRRTVVSVRVDATTRPQ
jgi:hypothetical protein